MCVFLVVSVLYFDFFFSFLACVSVRSVVLCLAKVFTNPELSILWYVPITGFTLFHLDFKWQRICCQTNLLQLWLGLLENLGLLGSLSPLFYVFGILQQVHFQVSFFNSTHCPSTLSSLCAPLKKIIFAATNIIHHGRVERQRGVHTFWPHLTKPSSTCLVCLLRLMANCKWDFLVLSTSRHFSLKARFVDFSANSCHLSRFLFLRCGSLQLLHFCHGPLGCFSDNTPLLG